MILHLIVSSAILVLALAAATWIRPLTARTRYAVLVAGMASLLIPSTLITEVIERSGTKVMMPLRVAMPAIMTAPAAPTAAASLPWRTMAVAIWLTIAAALFLRSLLVTHRLVANAVRVGTPPPARTIAALDAARRRLSLRASVDLIASPLCEAPAVLRVLRPIIVLPADGSGLEVEIAPEVQGKIDVNFTGVPWDEALERILRENGYTWRLEGKKLQIFKPAS